jgi:SAM-dependent methyltransferase
MLPTERFSSRVENYARYRPDYPEAVLDLLADACRLNADGAIADVGSGTGIFARQLLARGWSVVAIEPNAPMRQAAERWLAGQPRFRSVIGSAEATTLPDTSVDLITAAQAFHWLDRRRARAEFVRILRPAGQVALIWNERLTDSTPLLRDYEELLQRFGTDYREVGHTKITPHEIEAFFAPGRCAMHTFAHFQTFDFEGLQGRLLSSSYTPDIGDPRYEPMVRRLREIFELHHRAGQVVFEYTTRLYLGPLL